MSIYEEEQKGRWVVLETLGWCFNKYRFNKFIYKNNRCTPSNIRTKTGLNRKTINKYIQHYCKEGLIYKKPINGLQGNGARYTLHGTPQLKEWLNDFRRSIINFAQKIMEDENYL